MKRLFLAILLVLSVTGSAWSMDAASGSYKVDIAAVINGGGGTLSSNNNAIFTAIGENNINIYQLLSANYILWTGQGHLLYWATRELPSALLISDLRAYTEPLGSAIAEKTWQQDSDPYFTWKIEVEPPQLLSGFSVSIDTHPDNTLDTEAADYQFAENSIPSGKHTFYVLPISIDKGPEEASLLSFEIWVDREAPYINQLTPHPAEIVSDMLAAISCLVNDADSGLDLARATLTVNNTNVAFDYEPKTQILKSKPGTELSEGKNTVILKAYDQVGNYVTKGWDFIMDTQAPQGKILINNGQEVTHSAYVLINIEAKDEITQIKSIYLSNDGVFDTEMNEPLSYQPVISGWLLAQPDVDGRKTVYAKFQDTAGNLSETYQASIVLKRLTPDTRIISGPSSITEKTEAEFKYEASKPGCSFSYRLDNLGWSAWSNSDTAHFSGLAIGNHYFYAKSGFDLNGDGKISIDEEDATPAQWSWTVQPEGYLEKLRKRILFWRR